MHYRLALSLLLLFVLSLPILCATKAHAIPAFTRQHKTECTTCHTIYPELNEYGQAFLKNAYVYSAKGPKGVGQPDSKTAPGSAGSEINEGILLSGIPEWLPLSVTATQSITYNEHAPNNDDWDFSTRSLVLQAGGAFREVAGFYTTYNLFTHDSFPASDDNDLDELFIIGRRVFATPVNVKFGKFEPRLSLWKKSDKVIATSFASAAYKVGASPFSLENSQDALELNAVVANRVFVAAGIVDTEGQNTNDVYGHVSVKFGGADFLGKEPEIDFDSESIWDYLTLTLAAYGYAGRNTFTPGSSTDNDFYRAGGDADLVYKRLRLRFSGVFGRDNNPQYALVKQESESLVLASEVEYQFRTPIDTIGVFRYEYQDDGAEIVRRYIPAIAYAPLQNIRLALQYNYEQREEEDNKIALLTVAYSF